jgi:hypothetical protein
MNNNKDCGCGNIGTIPIFLGTDVRGRLYWWINNGKTGSDKIWVCAECYDAIVYVYKKGLLCWDQEIVKLNGWGKENER